MGSWRPSSRYTTARLLFNLAAGDCRAATGAMGFIVGLKEAWESFNRRRSAKSIFLQVSHECLWSQFKEMKDEANEMEFSWVSSRFCSRKLFGTARSRIWVSFRFDKLALGYKHFRKSMTAWRKLLKWLGSRRVTQLLIKFFFSSLEPLAMEAICTCLEKPKLHPWNETSHGRVFFQCISNCKIFIFFACEWSEIVAF